ncbi:phosphoglycerate mutase [Xylophilus rhododendri]|uniref:Phosphoglycerate mutase n=1 Tax=Xylophilus rhododendri TaxID=2697032 RepID=A0A857J1L2_9BURK|nr:phosphoglycerate mutase [Xylophilus rhododendri]QHI97596.1 phosphoglycerate mutase [Xylophilus rhododendri]
MHLLVPYASALAPGCDAARRSLELHNLSALLGRLTCSARDEAEEFSLSTPHERSLARLRGLAADDGQQPWAALAIADAGGQAGDEAMAWITPCHWQIAPDHISLTDPASLGLTEAESRATLALIGPYFTEDGITLEYRTPSTWLARGEIFRGMPSASLDRVTGRSLDLWMPDGPAARPLRRLQTEVQMLLYTHPMTDERNARGLPAVNAFWVSGTGALPASVKPAPPDLRVPQALREAALHEDWAAWRAAWLAVDAGECAEALKALDAGQPVTLTLCGERSAIEFTAQPRSLGQRIRGLFGAKPGLQDWTAQL